MFIDQVEISVQAGDGGCGCSSFRREKFVPLGGPDGGDGGKGGDLILQTDSNLSTLENLRYQKLHRAENGFPGRNKQMKGKGGRNCLIKVPLGTLVKDLDDGSILVDLKEKSQHYILARGGRGGQGNTRFKKAFDRTPTRFQAGEKGEAKSVLLELKLLADVGVIGLPNSGKSTLISKISNARPKISDYPFSTLVPNLGVVTLDDYFSFVVADIPGLVEGAHLGKGLGTQFLRHIERTRIVVHLVDFSPENERDPIRDYEIVQNELKCFSEGLFLKPQILVASKVDDPRAEEKFKLHKGQFKNMNLNIIKLSSIMGIGISDLLYSLKDALVEPNLEEVSNDE